MTNTFLAAAGTRRVEGALDVFTWCFAIWTVCVHAIVVTHSSFDTLLRWLPWAMLAAVLLIFAWSRRLEKHHEAAPVALPGNGAFTANRDGGIAGLLGEKPWLVLAFSVFWVGLLFVGLPYSIFWWTALVAMAVTWVSTLRKFGPTAVAVPKQSNAGWIVVAAVAIAAVCVTLFTSRPDPDDAFYQSIPATLLRFPHQPVLLHDTMYRLGNLPLLLPVYKVGSYEVLIAVLARLTGISHLVIAYLILPAVFAVLAVLAWARLLKLMVGDRWPAALVILLLCVLALGEAHQSYGNFAFVRLFQGKAIFATVMAPVIASCAIEFSYRASFRNWLLLFVAQVAAIGFTSSALFVAPLAAGLALMSGWSPNGAATRRLVCGVLASSYVFAVAGFLMVATRGGHGFVSAAPMPPMLDLIERTWGLWSTALLLVSLLAAWAWIDEVRGKRYALAAGLFFLLGVLDPYTSRFVADHLTGTSSYWRLTWALPLPFMTAAMLEGLLARIVQLKRRVVVVAACSVLLALAVGFGLHSGTLRSANYVTLGMPGLKVYSTEYPVARKVVQEVPEDGVVLAPELVATWLPTFVHHPKLLAVRAVYLDGTFGKLEGSKRLALMQYISGVAQTTHSASEFDAALDHYGLTCAVVLHAASWRAQIDTILQQHDWRRIDSGAYDVWVR